MWTLYKGFMAILHVVLYISVMDTTFNCHCVREYAVKEIKNQLLDPIEEASAVFFLCFGDDFLKHFTH